MLVNEMLSIFPWTSTILTIADEKKGTWKIESKQPEFIIAEPITKGIKNKFSFRVVGKMPDSEVSGILPTTLKLKCLIVKYQC